MLKLKKIAFVIESLHCGGAEKSLVTLLQNLDYTKYNVSLYLLLTNGEFQKFIPDEVTVKTITINKTNFIKQILKTVKFRALTKLNKLNKKNKYHPAQVFWKSKNNNFSKINTLYDVAIAYNQGFATYFVSEKIKARKKIAWLNTDYIKANYNINFDYKFYKNFDDVVCVSEENRHSLLKSLNKQQTISTLVIKDIVDDRLIHQLSKEVEYPFTDKENNKIILTVGRLADAKGLDLAIQACHILRQKKYNIKWYVIGEGPKRKELEHLINKLDISKYFILLGYKENPYPYIKSCNIYTQTSFFEGLGLTLIEASILQKPIVTTNFPTASKIIEHGRTGLICDMNADAIANSIEEYITSPKLVNKFTENLSKQKNNDKVLSLAKVNELLLKN
ncbi:glycosyltransferase [Seonamhaeicola algicola]|uniref:Glycosyltransferase n=1 Tax=Seonamhaeicola algicola TaxID=1719036 RepID=A0A5C7AVP1_9FLAO|nr:glycosyltransferase [Seonamhaeicola algicola]